MPYPTGMETYTVTEISVRDIVAGDNDRRHFDQSALEELAASIASDGLGQPPTVRPLGEGYQLVCGERRTRAMRDVLGWERIPCIVREMSDEEASALMLAENTARADLDPVEEARAYVKRIDAGASVADVARTAGRSVATVQARVALLKLSDVSLQMVSRGTIPLGHAVMMAGLDSNRQVLAIKAHDAQRLNAVAFGALCDRLMMEQNQEGMFDASSFMRAEEYATEALEVAAELKAPDHLASEIRRLQARIRQLEASADDLLGVQEISQALGVQERTVHQWQARKRLPERDATVSGLPAWKRSTVLDWAARTGRLAS